MLSNAGRLFAATNSMFPHGSLIMFLRQTLTKRSTPRGVLLAVAGVVAAIEQYERSLRTDGPDSVEDLWNITSGAAPTPKPSACLPSTSCNPAF